VELPSATEGALGVTEIRAAGRVIRVPCQTTEVTSDNALQLEIVQIGRALGHAMFLGKKRRIVDMSDDGDIESCMGSGMGNAAP
jgi:hypothetical protein